MTIVELPGAATPPNTEDLLPVTGDPVLTPGTKVEVRRRFDAKWARGFEVSAVVGALYRLRRLSDGEELPVLFAIDDVRKEKANNTWWY